MRHSTNWKRTRLDATAVITTAPVAIFDRVVALVALIALAPLILVVIICLAAESGLPVFFSQTRLGLDGRPFRLYKLRKFHRNVGAVTRPVTLKDDPRLTSVGRFIERTKLDEIPQFWNVLKGDMSLVGPRPEVPQFADCFSGRYRNVLLYKPGIFGPSQTAFRSEGSLYPASVEPEAFYRSSLFPTKAAIDLAYYPSRSLAKDIGWILRSFVVVIDVRPNVERSKLTSGLTLIAPQGVGGHD